jgi:predicted amidophosphoribosyltransferase
MAETTLENAVCDNCGADVRENTLFCYKCGSRLSEEGEASPHVTADTDDIEVELSPHDSDSGNGLEREPVSDETRAALDDLAQKFKDDDAVEADKLAAAAAERKKARVRPHKKREAVWEPVEHGPDRLFVLITLLICVISAAIVFLTVYWK